MASDTVYYSLFTTDVERNTVVQSNYIVWIILTCYIVFIKVIGPTIMKTRKPMELRLSLLIHHSFLVGLDVYLLAQVFKLSVQLWPQRCNIEDTAVQTERHKFYGLGLLLWLSRFLKLFDTVIYILRKEYHRVSFYHVYHHCIVFVFYWIWLKFRLMSYYLILWGTINITLDAISHLHYMFSVLDFGVRKYLLPRKYLSILTIVHFFSITAYMIFSFITGCEKFNTLGKFALPFGISLTVLYVYLHITSYNKTKKSS